MFDTNDSKQKFFEGQVLRRNAKVIEVLYDDGDVLEHPFTALSNANLKVLSAHENVRKSNRLNGGPENNKNMIANTVSREVQDLRSAVGAAGAAGTSGQAGAAGAAGAGTAVILPPKFRLTDADFVALGKHKAMVVKMPAELGPMRPAEGEPTAVLRVGDVSALRYSRTFDPRRVCIIDLNGDMALKCSNLGKLIDEALHQQAHLTNNSTKTAGKNQLMNLWEYAALVATGDDRNPRTTSSEFHMGGVMACDFPVPVHNTEIMYSQYGRCTADSDTLDAFEPGLYATVDQFVGEVCIILLTEIKDHCQHAFGSDFQTSSFKTSLLVSFPREPGNPTPWSCDPAGACHIQQGGKGRAARKRPLSGDVQASSYATRSSMLPAHFPFRVCFPCYHFSYPCFV